MIYIVSIFLGLSIFVNVVFWWYIREYLKSLNEIQVSLRDFQEEVEEYSESLQSFLSMEIYHGEPTIEALVKNTQQILSSFTDLGYVITNLLSGGRDDG